MSLAACAEIEPLERTGLYEVFTGHSKTTWCQEEDDGPFLAPGADLVGPNFSLSMRCHFGGTEVPDHVAAEIEQLAELPALLEGAELLINQLAFKPAHEMDAGGEGLEPWIEADGRRIDLDALPIRGDYLAVAVPAGAETVLWVEDQGRAQGIDLRTGAHIDPVEGYYGDPGISSVTTEGWEFWDVELWNGGTSWTVSCRDDWATVERSMWLPDQGWAPEGSAFLEVEFWWCGGEEVFEEVTWTLDVRRAVAVSDGSQFFEPFDWVQDEPEENGWQLTTVIFEVPAQTAEFKVFFTPASEVTEKESGRKFSPNGLQEIVTWEVAF